MRPFWTSVVVLLAAAALAATAYSSSEGRFTARGTGSRVVDGDTVDVRLAAGGGGGSRSYGAASPPPPPPDLDCKDIPYRNFRVVGADPHRFDGNRDGVGCEG